jgi:hypothetical protein
VLELVAFELAKAGDVTPRSVSDVTTTKAADRRSGFMEPPRDGYFDAITRFYAGQ